MPTMVAGWGKTVRCRRREGGAEVGQQRRVEDGPWEVSAWAAPKFRLENWAWRIGGFRGCGWRFWS
jgi:hypothetical protein